MFRRAGKGLCQRGGKEREREQGNKGGKKQSDLKKYVFVLLFGHTIRKKPKGSYECGQAIVIE